MANTQMLMLACAVVISAIIGIATSSIATECFNDEKHKKFKEEKKDNFNFVIVNLVCNILMILMGFSCTYLAIRG
jgi:uncharacterized membrane protein